MTMDGLLLVCSVLKNEYVKKMVSAGEREREKR